MKEKDMIKIVCMYVYMYHVSCIHAPGALSYIYILSSADHPILTIGQGGGGEVSQIQIQTRPDQSTSSS